MWANKENQGFLSEDTLTTVQNNQKQETALELAQRRPQPTKNTIIYKTSIVSNIHTHGAEGECVCGGGGGGLCCVVLCCVGSGWVGWGGVGLGGGGGGGADKM